MKQQVLGYSGGFVADGLDNGECSRTGTGIESFPCQAMVVDPGDMALQYPISTARVDNFFHTHFCFASDNNRR